MPCKAGAEKKLPMFPILIKDKTVIITPEKIIAAKAYKYPSCKFPLPKTVMAPKTATTKPFPGPVIVTFPPPNTETIIPPTIAEITPEIGGAPEAIANPKPRGKATNETTKPANKLEGIDLNRAITDRFDIKLNIHKLKEK
jgi:hypothetical protein